MTQLSISAALYDIYVRMKEMQHTPPAYTPLQWGQTSERYGSLVTNLYNIMRMYRNKKWHIRDLSGRKEELCKILNYMNSTHE